MPAAATRFNVNASWLIKLRWVAVIGQLLTIFTVTLVFGIKLEMFWALAAVISVTAISNLMLHSQLLRWQKNYQQQFMPWDVVLGLIMVMDMLSLTALLFATGGPNNPFSLFLFVNLSLSAVVLNRNWAWSLNLLGVLCFAWLLYNHHQIDELNLGVAMLPILERGNASLSQLGLLVAFTTCASVIVYFMTRMSDELRIQQKEVRRAQVRQARSEKLEALGTLAAGTAHELATPLSTIAVVAKDVEHAFEKYPPDFPGAEDVVDDIHLIRSQLDRCRSILDRMAGHAGQAVGETNQATTLSELTEFILADLPDRKRVTINLPEQVSEAKISIPRIGLSQAIRGLVQNALDADPSGRSVMLKISHDDGLWKWQIRDQGSGMSPKVLGRVSEPFFTTKPPGKGMGLGVFLAKNVIKRLGGYLEFASTAGQGTSVTITLPDDSVRTSETESEQHNGNN